MGYNFLSKYQFGVIQKMLNNSRRFEDEYSLPIVGVKSGYNKGYTVEFNSKHTRQVVFGKDIKRYAPIKSATKFIYPYNNGTLIDESDFEQVELAHLIEHEQKLRKRAIIQDGIIRNTKKWYEFQQINLSVGNDSEYIVYPNVTLGPQFSLSKGQVIDITGFVIKSSSRFLLGLLNSSLIGFLLDITAIKRRGGYSEYKVQYVSEIPIKRNVAFEMQIQELVDKIIGIKSQNPEADTTHLEAQIDLLVYKLYGLTHAEVLVVDPEFSMTESEYNTYQHEQA